MNLKKKLKSSKKTQYFPDLILNWFKKHGRTTLPWQKNKTPYRVFVSEIMLQQTQVTTVIPYFERFMEQFPNISSLAKADEDKVLHLWTGLGYYSRARNLHKTAKLIHQQFQGEFPDTLEALEKLPGIGRSTAGAILSIAFKKPTAILDGNVKRVLTRFHGITTSPTEKNTLATLWHFAEQYTPQKNPDAYTQAIMDLGATVCIRGKPLCEKCPLLKICVAHKLGIEKTLPISNTKKTLPTRKTTLLFIQNKNTVLLNKRPATGIWGGLWCPPQLENHASLAEIKKNLASQFKFKKITLLPIFRHTFTHFHLTILPAVILANTKAIDSDHQIWYNLSEPQSVGLPAPVKKLLRNLL